jgi:hypothetical protein
MKFEERRKSEIDSKRMRQEQRQREIKDSIVIIFNHKLKSGS